jgi:hypothetical protein
LLVAVLALLLVMVGIQEEAAPAVFLLELDSRL